MRISVINCTRGRIRDVEVQRVIRAVNRQIKDDFEPYWHIGGRLRLEGMEGTEPNPQNPISMRGDAIIYLWDNADVAYALGYHEANNRGIPFGFVFTELARELGEHWSVTFSHEVLEMLGDRNANHLLRGPHPDPNEKGRIVYHWHEMCDAVQSETYEIDGVAVSNFVLPLYFSEENETGSRNDFLNSHNEGKFLSSFGVKPGGYVGFYDPKHKGFATYALPNDPVAQKRRETKAKMQELARINRNQDHLELLMPVADTDADIEHKATLGANEKFIVFEQKAATGFAQTNINLSCPIGISVEVEQAASLEQIEQKLAQKRSNRLESDNSAMIAKHQALKAMVDEGEWEELAAVSFDTALYNGKRASAPQNSTTEVKIKLPDISDDDKCIAVVIDDKSCQYFFADKKGEFTIPTRCVTATKGNVITRAFKRIVRIIKVKVLDKIRKAITDNVTAPIIKYVADKVEHHFKTESLLQFKPKKLPKSGSNKKPLIYQLTKAPALPENKHYLLFIHGIISSVEGAFGSLLELLEEEQTLGSHPLQTIARKYQHIIGFNHHTLSKSVTENVQDLIKKLPKNSSFDIICHSRGAAITRLLLENDDNVQKLKVKRIKVKKVLFVAGACKGSPLADSIDTLVNVINGLSAPFTSFGLQKLLELLANGVESLPGVDDMKPNAAIFDQMNQLTFANHYGYMRADYDPANPVFKAIDQLLLDKKVFDGDNDLVVPFEGAKFFGQNQAQDLRSFGKGSELNDEVHHTNFFKTLSVRKEIAAFLKDQ